MDEEVTRERTVDDEVDPMEDVVVADLVEEYRHRKQAAEEQAVASSDARYVAGVVEDVEPRPAPPTSKTVPELVERGYTPRQLDITVRRAPDTVETLTYSWSHAQDILSWYADGTLRGLLNETVILDTEGNEVIELPDDTNLRTSRLRHRLRMGFLYHLGAQEQTVRAALGLLSFVIGLPLVFVSLGMPLLHPENPPLWAVLTFFTGPFVGCLLLYMTAKSGLAGTVRDALRKLNRVDS